jgi:SAM-dependent methyltransferase
MAARDRIRWDEAYREKANRAYPDANALLFPYTPPLRAPLSATALDLAAGLGQNGLWLAEQGYLVNLVDVSRVALARAQIEAAHRGLHNVNFFQLDLDHAQIEPASYDLICVFRFLNRDLIPPIRAAIKPGGRVIYQTFNTRYLGQRPDLNADYLLSPGELAGFFGDWRVLHSSEPEHTSQIVAIKPK